MKKKRQHKSKYSVKKRKRYQAGGSMYADNTVQSAGQGAVGTTANIVFQESNPAVLEAKLQKLEEAKQNAMTKNDQVQSDIAQQDVIDKQNVALAEQESDQQFESGENIAKQGVEAYDKFQEGAAALATSKLKKEAAARAAKSIAGEGFGNAAREKLANETTSMLANQLTPKGTEIALNSTSGGSSSLLTSFQPPPPVMPTAPVMPPPGVVPPTPAVNAVANTGTTVGAEIGKTAVKEGTSKLAGVGGAGAAGTTGLAKFATSGAGLGTIASLAGMGISKLSDDGDPTKSNFGEYSGSILSSAGTGAGIGSLLGPVGTAVGAGIGALYGAGKQFFGTRKAKREERRLARAKKKKVDKYNKELVTNLASANAQARAGEIEQKTYSGYDLGRNVVARYGGNRLQMPKYA